MLLHRQPPQPHSSSSFRLSDSCRRIGMVYVPQIRRQLAAILLLAQRNIRNQRKNMPTLILHRFFLSGQPWFRIEVPSYMDPDRLVVTLMPRSQEMHPGELYGTDWHCTLPVRLDLVSGNFIEHGIMLKSDAELLGHQLHSINFHRPLKGL